MMVGLVGRGCRALLGSSTFSRIVSRLETASDTQTNLLRVLTYHRIDWPESTRHLYPGTLSSTPDEFHWQMEYLSTRYHMVDVHTVLDAIRGDCELPPRSLLITFDDAYTDFAEHAWPTLLEYEIPAVLFVPTAYPDSQQVFWWDRLQQVAHESGVLDTAEGRHRFRKFIQHVKSLPHSETLACVDDYCESHNEPCFQSVYAR